MKRINIFISLLLVLLLISCSDGRKVRRSGYDISDLETCMLSLSDNDQDNNCTQENRVLYLTDYAEYFISDIDDSLKSTSVELLGVDIVGQEDILLTINYSDISMVDDFDYDIYQQIFEEISYDISELTDVETFILIEFEFSNYLTLRFISSNNTQDNDDYHARDFWFYTQDQLAQEMFDDSFEDFIDILDDEAYKATNLIIESDDYNVIVGIWPIEMSYVLTITSKTSGYFMSKSEISTYVGDFLKDYNIPTPKEF